MIPAAAIGHNSFLLPGVQRVIVRSMYPKMAHIESRGADYVKWVVVNVWTLRQKDCITGQSHKQLSDSKTPIR